MKRKLRFNRIRRGDQIFLRVEQYVEGDDTWVPLPDFDYASNNTDHINSREHQYRMNFGQTIVETCENCDAIIESKNQRKCKKCHERVNV